MQDFQVVRDGRPRQGRDFGDLPDIEPFARLEQQQDALPVLVAKRDENAGHHLPRGRDGLGVIILHVDNISYIDMLSSTIFLLCRRVWTTMLDASASDARRYSVKTYPVATPFQRILYWFVGQLCFNRITVAPPPAIPQGGPVLYIGLHRNGALDGIPYLQAVPDAAFLVSAQLHRSVFGRMLFPGIGIARNKDRKRGIVADNQAGIDRCIDHLSMGGKLFIMPEGTSSLGPRHLPFKTGAARIAQEVIERCGTLTVVPLAIHYESAVEWQSHVEVIAGKPLILSASADSPLDVSQLQRHFTDALEEVGINIESDDQLRFIEMLAYGATLGTGLSYAACLKHFEAGVTSPLRAGAGQLAAATEQSVALKHQGVPLMPIGSALPYLFAWVLLAPLIVIFLTTNLPPVLAGYWASRTLPDDRNVIAFWRTLVGPPVALLWAGLFGSALFATWGLPALSLYAATSIVGLKMFYRFRKLSVAVFNSLFAPHLKQPLLAFRSQLLRSLGRA